MNEHQDLAGAHDSVVVDLMAIQNGQGAWIDVEPLPESITDLAHGAVADRQTFHIRSDGDSDEAGGLMRILIEDAAEASGGLIFALVFGEFDHEILRALKLMGQQSGLGQATERCHANSIGQIDILPDIAFGELIHQRPELLFKSLR